jgi:hypothetical protein
MMLEERARHAADAIHRSVELMPAKAAAAAAGTYESFLRFAERRRRAERVTAIVVAAILVVAAFGAAIALLRGTMRRLPADTVITPDSVAEFEALITGRARQYIPFANDTYIAYTRSTDKAGQVALAMSISNGTTTQLNAEGTQGSVGGFDPGTNRVAFMQWGDRPANLWFYDLDSGERSKIPGVNTRDWETAPRISSTFIAFVRWYEAGGDAYADLLVFDREIEETRTIGTWREWSVLEIEPSFVGDRYLTYTLCKSKKGEDACRPAAYLYDLETDTRQLIPTANDRQQQAAVVDEVNSTVYFSRISDGCGGRILRLPIDLTGDPATIAQLPDGVATGYTASLTSNTSTDHLDLYETFWNCTPGAHDNDIYVARAVDAEPTA